MANLLPKMRLVEAVELKLHNVTLAGVFLLLGEALYL